MSPSQNVRPFGYHPPKESGRASETSASMCKKLIVQGQDELPGLGRCRLRSRQAETDH